MSSSSSSSESDDSNDSYSKHSLHSRQNSEESSSESSSSSSDESIAANDNLIFTKKSPVKSPVKPIVKVIPGLKELNALYDFMKQYRQETKAKSGKNLPWTHAMLFEPYGKYNIPENIYRDFIKLYENVIVAGYYPYITEKHKEFGPIVIDLDFVTEKNDNGRYYTRNTIYNIVQLYNQVINKYLDVVDKNFDAYICEKERPTLKNGQYHDGIHIVYPYICTKPSLQMLMRSDFIKSVEDNRIFKKLRLVNSLEEVVDKQVIYFTGWLLYGSRKNNKSYPYLMTSIYKVEEGDIKVETISKEEASLRINIKHYINALSCRRFFNEDDITPLSEDVDPSDIDAKINETKAKLTNEQKIKNDNEVSNLMGRDLQFSKIAESGVLSEARELVKMLSAKRASTYHSWYQVGHCLHNIDIRLLDEWIKFSKKCPEKFKKGECEALWKKMKNCSYTIASLYYFAAIDDPETYQKYKDDKLKSLIINGMEGSHNAIAKILMEKYKFRFKCASVHHKMWFEFQNHRWVDIDNAYSLRNLISDELTKDYLLKQRDINESIAKETNSGVKAVLIAQTAQITKVIKQLNNNTFKNSVINECADIAHAQDPGFLKKINTNLHLICFENGVYDLREGVFRDGCPDDCITLCTNYNYLEYDKNDESVAEIIDFLKKIQTDREMRKYLMTLLSTCLEGSVKEESFYVFTGSGANGKSKLMELMKYTLGDYFKPMDVRIITGKRSSSSAASPELADKMGVRCCPLDEPDHNDEINTGFMKYFTGGDSITARALYKEPIYFKPQFKPFLLCNHLPTIKSDDEGTWRRLKVVEFSSKFHKYADATEKMLEGLEPGHFWADIQLSDKIQEWRQVFMGMLLLYYDYYKKNGLVHPKKVTSATDDYRRKCDIYQDFINDYLVKVDDETSGTTMVDLYSGFRTWYKNNYDGKNPNAKMLREYVRLKMPTFHRATDTLRGYLPKDDVDENNSFKKSMKVDN